MSSFDYQRALELSIHRFSSLMMAAMMAGREDQAEKLRRAFPELAQELEQRRRSPDGRTAAEAAFDALELPR